MSKRLKEPKICSSCGKNSIWFTGKICQNCYRKYVWKRKKIICRRCKRLIYMKGKGLCGGCYQTVYQLEKIKAWNHKKNYNIDIETYKKITSKCVICDFNKVVDLHHLDGNKKNNTEKNLIGLCPNHHKMLHTLKYKEEILKLLREKGLLVPIEVKIRVRARNGIK